MVLYEEVADEALEKMGYAQGSNRGFSKIIGLIFKKRIDHSDFAERQRSHFSRHAPLKNRMV